MNTKAITVPKDLLLGELESSVRAAKERLKEKDAAFGGERVRVVSYMENIGWPELFGYEMPRYFSDPGFQIEQYLRQQIFWFDNVDDDTLPVYDVPADVGMYWDVSLFGQGIRHDAQGIPSFESHPISKRFDPALFGRFDFFESGEMPLLISKYERMTRIAREEYGGGIRIVFPSFHRGPLDVYIQMRGYEGFLEDVAERPDELKNALFFLTEERLRFAKERARYLGETALPETTFIADDWVNIPFISPAMFTEFFLPLYRRINETEGRVSGFHTCGNMEQVTRDLICAFPDIHELEVSGWNDIERIDALLSPEIGFLAHVINTVSLGSSVGEKTEKLKAVSRVSRHRKVRLCAQAIVKLLPSYEETFERLNEFLALSRRILADHA